MKRPKNKIGIGIGIGRDFYEFPKKSVRDKLNEGYYKNKKTAPYNIKKVCPECNTPFKEGDNYCSKCAYTVNNWYNSQLEELETIRKDYYAEENRLYELFKEESLEEVGLKDHPKKDKIFYYAWEHGHSHGFSDVLSHLKNVAELFID